MIIMKTCCQSWDLKVHKIYQKKNLVGQSLKHHLLRTIYLNSLLQRDWALLWLPQNYQSLNKELKTHWRSLASIWLYQIHLLNVHNALPVLLQEWISHHKPLRNTMNQILAIHSLSRMWSSINLSKVKKSLAINSTILISNLNQNHREK